MDYLCCKEVRYRNWTMTINQYDPTIVRKFKDRINWEDGWQRTDKIAKWNGATLSQMKEECMAFETDVETLRRGIMKPSMVHEPAIRNKMTDYEKMKIINAAKNICKIIEKTM